MHKNTKKRMDSETSVSLGVLAWASFEDEAKGSTLNEEGPSPSTWLAIWSEREAEPAESGPHLCPLTNQNHLHNHV